MSRETSQAGSRSLMEFCRAPSLAHTFINDWDTGLEGVGNKFAHDTKLGGAVDSLKGRDTDRLERWAVTKCMKFNKGR